jgi:hypothetical protein
MKQVKWNTHRDFKYTTHFIVFYFCFFSLIKIVSYANNKRIREFSDLLNDVNIIKTIEEW